MSGSVRNKKGAAEPGFEMYFPWSLTMSFINTHKDGRRDPTPRSLPLTSDHFTCAWQTCAPLVHVMPIYAS